MLKHRTQKEKISLSKNNKRCKSLSKKKAQNQSKACIGTMAQNSTTNPLSTFHPQHTSSHKPPTRPKKISFSTQVQSEKNLDTSRNEGIKMKKEPLVVMGIETSCDDTSISIVTSDRQILANSSLNQLGIHQLHGGVVPTIAMRSHAITINQLVAKAMLKAGIISTSCTHPTQLPINNNITPTFILPHVDDNGQVDNKEQIFSFQNTNTKTTQKQTKQPTRTPKHPSNNYLAPTPSNELWLELELDKMDQFRQHLFLRQRTATPTPDTFIHPSLTIDCDAIAFTLGPGLSGSLAVGVDTAKALGTAFKVPIIPVNHIIAHTTVVQLDNPNINYPYLGLVISGGHTQLNYIKDEQTVTVLASTVDDAIGEAFDKIYRGMDMESFDFNTIQALINHEQPKILKKMKKLQSLWPEDIHEHIAVSGNELLMDCYDRVVNGESGGSDYIDDNDDNDDDITFQHRHRTHDPLHASIQLEQSQIHFIQKIQLVPPIDIKKVHLEPIGNVDDLYNNQQTPQAFFATFNEALSKLQNTQTTSNTKTTLETTQSNQTTQKSTSPDSNYTQTMDNTPKVVDDEKKKEQITPKSEREVLEALSKHKSIPHGAQIEQAARMHTDVHNILHAYDFMIQFCTRAPTPLMVATDHNRMKFFEIETNRAFGGMRKAGKLLPLQRFLPIIPLPLPIHVPTKDQSYSSLSYSGFKTKIRQHIQQEITFMNSIEKLINQMLLQQMDENNENNNNDAITQRRYDWDHHNEKFHDNPINPYSRAMLKTLDDTPVYLRYLLDTQQEKLQKLQKENHHQNNDHQNNNHQNNHHQNHQNLPPYSKMVSNLYKLCVSAQFQMTATEHLISKMTRAIQYLDHALKDQEKVLLMIQPQGLDQLLLSTSDPSFHIGHPSHSPNYEMWGQFVGSVLQKVDGGDGGHDDGAIDINNFHSTHNSSNFSNSTQKTSNESSTQITTPLSPTIPKRYNDIVIGGGVACNKYITENIKYHFQGFEQTLRQIVIKNPRAIVDPSSPSPQSPQISKNDQNGKDFDQISSPQEQAPLAPFRVTAVTPSHCADNGTMIAWAGLNKFKKHQDGVDKFINDGEVTKSSNGQAYNDINVNLSTFGTDTNFSNRSQKDYNTHLESSHIIDPIALRNQQDAMDRHFIRLYGNTVITTGPDGQKIQGLPPPSRAEEFSTLYQRPKWPLHELFIQKPGKQPKR